MPIRTGSVIAKIIAMVPDPFTALDFRQLRRSWKKTEEDIAARS